MYILYIIISIYYLLCPINIFYNGYLNVSDQLKQLLEVGDTESSCRIPALGRIPERSGNDTRLDKVSFDTKKKSLMQKGITYTRKRASGLGVVAVAADRLATGNIGKALVGISVNQRIQESESRLAFTETSIVQEGNNTGHDGRGRRSTTAGSKFATLEHGIAVQMVSGQSGKLLTQDSLEDETYSGLTL